MKARKMKKRYIVLILLAVLVIILAGLVYWQRENIMAVKDFTDYTKEEIEEQLQQNDQAIKDAIDSAEDVTIRDVTEEEREALKDGSLTQEELIDRLLGNETEEPNVEVTPEPEQTEQPQESATPDVTPGPAATPTPTPVTTPVATPTPSPTPTPEQSEYQKKLSELVAKVFVLREEFLISLDNLLEEAKEVYKTTPKEERTGTWLANTVSDYIARGTAMEKDCDRQMNAIVAEMEALIKENDGDMSLIDTVIETYANEKRLKKAWYMSKLEERGLT